MNRMSILPAALFILVGSANAQTKETGELHLYSHSTQIGVVANREFKDDKGRVVKVIYYSGGGEGLKGPFREELLREHSIQTNQFDDNGCNIKSESFAPGMKLTGTGETICFEGTAQAKLITTRNARGIRTAEIRKMLKNDYSSDKSTLYFDASGEKVIGLNGDIPTDVDLRHGWGASVSGFALGIAANREKGRQDELEVWSSIKNIDRVEEGLPMVTPFLIELKDSKGNLVDPVAAYADDRNRLQSEECPRDKGVGAPFAGSAQLQSGFSFRERYRQLTPGRYSITIKYCLGDTGGLLISNTIDVEIEGPVK
jgi:hypothetical protein